MQDILINLNGGENLFKLFDTQRPRKRTTNQKSSREKSSSFNIQNIWILPGHILALSGKKLLAYDQLPKLGPFSLTQEDLLAVSDNFDVFDVYYTTQSQQEFVFVVLKSGNVFIWAFKKPAYKWTHVSSFSLCKGKGSQIVSIVYNEFEKMFVWCEKRSSSQCCVCSTQLNFSSHNGVSITGICALLHNCLPITIYLLSVNMFCFVPLSPAGLLLFWLVNSPSMTVHMWGENFNRQSVSVTMSDFQSIVTTCISLWINLSVNENRIIGMTTHPSTKELIVLQNNLHVYLVKCSDMNKIKSLYISSLEVTNEREYFAKQVVKIYSLHRLIAVLLVDGVINIFEFRGGLFLWKTETFKSNSPKIWIRKGPFPAVGVWNKSGIWILRSKSITDQILDFRNSRKPVESDKEKVEKVADVDFALDVFEEQKKSHIKKHRRRIKQGENRSTDIPVSYLFPILNQWQLTNVSTEIALSISVKIKELLKDENIDEDVDLDELMCVLDEIKDPVLLLVLFTDKVMPACVKGKLMRKLQESLNATSTRNIERKIMSILNKFMDVEKEIVSCFEFSPIKKVTHANQIIMENELERLERIVNIEKPDLLSIEKSLLYLSEHDELNFIKHVSSILLFGESHQNKKAFSELLWKVTLSRYTSIFNKVCILLWKHTPALLLDVLKVAEERVDSVTSNSKEVLSVRALVSRGLELIHLPEINMLENDISNAHTRIHTYCACLRMSGLETSEEEMYDFYIQYNLINDALEILQKYVDNTQKHYSMFYKLFTLLVRNRQIGSYVDRLKNVTPENFNIAEVYNVLCNESAEMGGGPVFVKTSKDLSVEMFQPILSTMLK